MRTNKTYRETYRASSSSVKCSEECPITATFLLLVGPMDRGRESFREISFLLWVLQDQCFIFRALYPSKSGLIMDKHIMKHFWSTCFIFGALCPFKSGLIHKHIVKHIVVQT